MKPSPCINQKQKLNKMPTRLQKYINKNKEPDKQILFEEVRPYDKIKSQNLMHLAPPTIYGVYYICCMGNYKEIIEEQMESIQRSGLYAKVKTIFCFICQFQQDVMDVLEPYMSKLKIISTTENLYERYALENYQSHIPATTRVYYMFYFHTKGVSRPLKTIFHQTRKCLDYFILERHELCIFWLNHSYDAVGVSLSLYPKLHFSGNFWWAKSTHMNRLPNKIVGGYYGPEMHVCSVPDGKYISICQTTNNGDIETYRGWSDTTILHQSTCVPVKCVHLKNMRV